jgi:bifunctional non-homologous end joining protein LigD
MAAFRSKERRKKSQVTLEPIVPFEPVGAETIPEGERWTAQIKWDGVRILTYYDGREWKLFNRKRRERTFHYPELADIRAWCSARSVILDGEMIALGPDGKPSFHEVMRRDGIRRLERVKETARIVPVTYMVFDIVYCDGEWVNRLKLAQRQKMLRQVVIPGEHVQIVSSHSDARALFEVVKGQGMEGIVVKDLNSGYAINGKDDRWRKIKCYRDLNAVIGGVTMRGGIVNAVLLGLYDDKGRLHYIGHAGTGRLTREDWRLLTERIRPLVQRDMPFANRPDRHRDAIWVRPLITARIQYAEWTEGRSLRQPSIQAFVDVPPEQCTFLYI